MNNIYLPIAMIIWVETTVVKGTQRQYFSAELLDLKIPDTRGVKSSSSLYKLDPFVEGGLLYQC